MHFFSFFHHCPFANISVTNICKDLDKMNWVSYLYVPIACFYNQHRSFAPNSGKRIHEDGQHFTQCGIPVGNHTLPDMNVLSLISPVVSNTFIVEMADRIILVRIAISVEMTTKWLHDDVIKWKLFPRYWPFVWGIHRSAVNFRHKEQWRGASMFSLICAWTNCWSNNRDTGDLRAIALIMTPRWWIP